MNNLLIILDTNTFWGSQEFNNLFLLITSLTVFSAIAYGVIKAYNYLRNNKRKRYETEKESFEKLVGQLASDNKTSQLASAILLRKYFDEARMSQEKKNGKKGYFLDLKTETINLISSVLRVLPSGIFQKTLADGLAYAKDLSKRDLQKTNLQDAFLDNKNGRLTMNETDLYLADLSYANMTGVDARGIILYKANLFCTSINDCDFTDANFRYSDLAGISIRDCTLKGADFMGAHNLPKDIKDGLVEELKDGKKKLVFNKEGKVSAEHEKNGKSIFFSMPGVMKKEEEILTKEYQKLLMGRGYDVIYYSPDKYPGFGQFEKVKADINNSAAMIVFGYKQVHVDKGICRQGTKDESIMDGKWFSTSWNDIEGGMGLMKGLPILLVYDFDINNGIFDNKLSECFVLRLSTGEDIRTIDNNPVFREWLSRFE